MKQPVSDLVSSLKSGFVSARTTEDPLIRDLILLAHWEAQSFYEEKYTDLYDFCFRLKVNCEKAKPSSAKTKRVIKRLWQACVDVMEVLKRGDFSRDRDDTLIVRCEFCGPAYQYSHGMSVFFPWSEPVGSQMWDKQYVDYEFNQHTEWQSFLKDYFKETMRKPQGEEQDTNDETTVSLDRELLELLNDINTAFFNDEDQLKGGSKDPLGPGKGGSRDPTGSDCECSSIKNYPFFTRPRNKSDKKEREPKRAAVNLFKSLGPAIRER